METARAVVLCSGGLDSIVCTVLAAFDYREVRAVSVYYGQRHTIELQYAAHFLDQAGIRQHKVTIDPSIWKQVPLVSPPEFVTKPDPQDDGLEKGRPIYAIRDGGIPRSFVPGRNLVFLTHAIALADTLGGGDVLYAPNLDDAIGFPDCRPEAVDAFDKLAQAATSNRVRVRAPLLFFRKRQIAWLAQQMGLDPALTWSCYSPRTMLDGVIPCGRCDACVLRHDALTNPTPITDGLPHPS